jgi:predicted transcriptional regulator
MQTLCIRLSKDLEEKLEREARLVSENRSAVARAALGHYLAYRERERFLEQIEAAARAMAENPQDSRSTAEEFLAADNEALERADMLSADAGKAK